MNTTVLGAWRRWLVAAAIIVLVGLGLAGTASAHAELESSNPSPGAVLDVSPPQILLTFSESVDPVPGSLRLVAADGSAVQLGAVRQNLGASTIAADVPSLADGSYVVAWKAISSDSHPVSGAFTFSVGAPTNADPGLVASLTNSNKPAQPAELLLAVGRWASYLGITVLVGAVMVLGLLAPIGLRTKRSDMLLV
ncbi:MAG: copper resistance CopC family protein, partial [Ilumatobacteraceae bacterium]